MNLLATIFHIILSLTLITLIFMQSKGSQENSNLLSNSIPERRGWEKAMFNLTLVIAALFLISSISQSLS